MEEGRVTTGGRGKGEGDDVDEGVRPEAARKSVSHVAALARLWATICRALRFLWRCSKTRHAECCAVAVRGTCREQIGTTQAPWFLPQPRRV